MSVTRIAARAGVSIATVSRVLNNHRQVNPKMAEQVRAAMAELEYAPQSKPRKTARSRRSKKADGAIAIVSVGHPCLGWFEMPVMASVVAEITRVAADQKRHVLIAEMPDPEKLSPVLRRGEVAGALVIVAQHLSAASLRSVSARLPVVRVMGGELGPGVIDHVAPDNVVVGCLAGEYLVNRGCRRLAFATFFPEWDVMRMRAHGFSIAAQQGGVAAGDCTAYVLAGGDSSMSILPTRHRPQLEALVDALAAARPDGLFVSRDEEVVPIYRMLAERGLKPGRDIHVISCDNEKVRLSTLFPPPASIELGTAEVARQAIRRLTTRIEHPDEPPVRVLVQPQLVLPKSSPNGVSQRVGPKALHIES